MTDSHEVVTIRSGARAIRDCHTGEVMHPGVGPLDEARDLYVASSSLGRRLGGPGEITLLDVGLGAGSNAVAAVRESESRPQGSGCLRLVSFDRTTAALELALAEANAERFGLDGAIGQGARELIATGQWEGHCTHWSLVLGELPDALTSEQPADVVFWDPFSLRANPELWTVAAFRRLRGVCGSRATVHTYSTATSVRAALLLAGFFVGYGPATGDKRETTAAATTLDDLQRPLGKRWLSRLTRSSVPLPPDAPGDALAKIRSHPQF